MQWLARTRFQPMDGRVQGLPTRCCPLWGEAPRACHNMLGACNNMLSGARPERHARSRLWLLACFAIPLALAAPEAKSAEPRLFDTPSGVAVTRVLLMWSGATARHHRVRSRFHCLGNPETGKPLGMRTSPSEALSSESACPRPTVKAVLKALQSCTWRILRARSRPRWMLPRSQLRRRAEPARTLDDGEPPSPRDLVHFRIPRTSDSANQPQGLNAISH